MRHSNAAFHLCPVAFRAAPPAAGAANGNGANGTGPKASYGPLPKPPPVSDEPLTVDEAWRLFGIPQKRGRKEDVKKRYLEFIQKHHPDKHPKNQKKANEQCSRANQAWALLQKHCKW